MSELTAMECYQRLTALTPSGKRIRLCFCLEFGVESTGYNALDTEHWAPPPKGRFVPHASMRRSYLFAVSIPPKSKSQRMYLPTIRCFTQRIGVCCGAPLEIRRREALLLLLMEFKSIYHQAALEAIKINR